MQRNPFAASRNLSAVHSTAMLSAQLVGRRRIGLLRCPIPRVGAGEVLVRIRAVGICRSDVHYFTQGKIGNQVIRSYPQPLGHEPAGEIALVGKEVKGLFPGDRVAIEPAMPCGNCSECRRGAGNTCPAVKFLGMPGQPGAFAEYIAVPAANAEKIPSSMPFEIAAALEPLAVGMHAVRLAGKGVRKALVIGAGPIGLCVMAVLKSEGAKVEICDFHSPRLRAARRMGAYGTVLLGRRLQAGKALKRLSSGFDAVFEAGGTVSAVELAIAASSPGKIVALIGIPEADLIPVNIHAARRKELILVNVRRSNGELGECIRRVSSGRINLKPMISHVGSLSRTKELFSIVEGYKNGVIKAIIRP